MLLRVFLLGVQREQLLRCEQEEGIGTCLALCMQEHLSVQACRHTLPMTPENVWVCTGSCSEDSMCVYVSDPRCVFFYV